MKTIAFIGAGNMGGAFIRAACKAAAPEQVVITDFNAAQAQALAEELGCRTAENNAAAAETADTVVLCVKPQVLPGVLSALAPCFNAAEQAGQPKLLVSIAAGVTTGRLRELVGSKSQPIIRVMPNMPCLTGRGLSFFTTDGSASPAQVAELRELTRFSGATEYIDEALMDQATVIASCSPAFVFLFIEALADGGVKLGLPRDKALNWAANAVMGSAATLLDSGKHPGVLKDMVCSPAGSTIEGVIALENGAFRADVIDAVCSAYQRNVDMGK